MSYLLLACAVVLNVATYAFFKAIAVRPHDMVWSLGFAAALGCGLLNSLCFSQSIRVLPMSVAFPVFSGASIALVVAMSVSMFGERLGGPAIVGAVLVCAGIVLLTR